MRNAIGKEIAKVVLSMIFGIRNRRKGGIEMSDWEMVNLGCMFSEINNTIGELQRVIEDDKQMSERYFTREEYKKVVDVLKMLDVKRSQILDRIHDVFVESEKSSDETQEDEESDEEYRIEEEDESDDRMVRIICVRRGNE